MNKRIVFSLAAAFILLGNSLSYSAETNAAISAPAPTASASTNSHEATDALNLLVARIKAKLELQKQNEADYADIIKDFDALLAKHTTTNDDRLNIIAEKAKLYLFALNDPVKALPVFQQIRTEFPTIEINGNSEAFLAELKNEADRQKIRDALKPGTPFPDFNEKDLHGNALSISKYKGKVLLVDFWATWCAPCVAALPELQKVYNKYHDKGFEVVGISLDEEKDALEKFIKQKKMPWPEYFEGKRFDGKLPMKYGINQTPTTYLIDRQGKIIKRLAGDENLDEEIAKALKS